ncbi:MAG: DUF4091 domain-containing protein [Armatimonadetes bacterium]|nr:DUF4091 domain-containing protein [Armatimonadota bacterium]
MAQIQAHALYEPSEKPLLEASGNLFLKAEVSASSHWNDREPSFAVDGDRSSPGNHWAAENIPVWLMVELKEAREINTVRLFTFWDNRRYYRYYIEGSPDGQSWSLLADHRRNTAPATEIGDTFHFPAAKVRFVRVTFTHNSASDSAEGHIVEIEGYRLGEGDILRLTGQESAWKSVAPGLKGAVGSLDVRYRRDSVPEAGDTKSWKASAWRGERASGQLALWTADGARQVRLSARPLRGEDGAEIPIRVRFVRYVLGDGQLYPDILDTAERLDLSPRTARPVWLSVDVPARANPGLYRGEVNAHAEGGDTLSFPVEVEVLSPALPAPSQWSFWLDLWQNPYAVARYHHVEPWSPEHVRLMTPHLKLLAEAGQKCVTATIVYQAWGTQTYDPYGSMVEWLRLKDGSWRFDYTHFDQYVELCRRCGITGGINCYSMASWGAVRYLDETTGDYAWTGAQPGTPEYEALWRPFLKSFIAHLKERGWLDKTAVAMDERPIEIMKPLIDFIRSAAPGMKLALAGSNEPELKEEIHDWCVFIDPPLDPAIARERARKGLPTTFYVCCGPGRPNTFTFSPPAESAWMGWYAAARDYTGFLRWAYDSWVQDPFFDSSYVTWPAGDCFMVYPGARSSIRFERLREGIQDFEKVRLARAALSGRKDEAARNALQKLNEALSRFTYASVLQTPAAETVNAAKAALEEASRAMGGK